VEGCVVKKVGLEGLRTGGGAQKAFKNIVFRGNYIERVAGDGIVLAQTSKGSVVESNIIKDASASPETTTGCYAAAWAYYADNCVFRYNEAYGTLYGYHDGEAWDFDNQCNYSVYEYNYSHHNQGGAMLFMGSQYDNVFRFNISANDGGGTKYMGTVLGDDVKTDSKSYTDYDGQSIIHYQGQTSSNNTVPLIYNNTFYVGPGLSTALFGYVNQYGLVSKHVRFFNNIVLKAGEGLVRLSYMHYQGGSYTPHEANFSNYASGGFKNNIFWGYDTSPATGDYAKFRYNGSNFSAATFDGSMLGGTNNNKWQNPALKIQEIGGPLQLRPQRDDVFPGGDYADPAALAAFTGVSRLRQRASLFSPVSSSTVTGGLAVPKGTSSAGGAWNNGPALTADFFGHSLSDSALPIGAANAAY
jgi:hypothetical protein